MHSVRWNLPLARAWYLKEAFQLLWTYPQPGRAEQSLSKWMNSDVIQGGADQEVRADAKSIDLESKS